MTKAFVSGNFNVLHPGHVRLLRFAREVSDYLTVGVWSDSLAGKDAHIPETLRLEGVRSNIWVDKAFLLTETIEDVINKIRPDIVVKGKEYELEYNPELQALEKYGGKLIFSSGETLFSSLDLIQKDITEPNYIGIEFPQSFANRHNFSRKRLVEVLEKIKKLNVCVVGDLIVDEYVTCQPLGMSQEDPSLVVTPIDSQLFLGGAGIVASHAANLGANVNFISVAGTDLASEFAEQELTKYRVKFDLYREVGRPTTLKQRFRASEKTLLRVSHLHQAGIDLGLQEKILHKLRTLLPTIDVLIFSDFNYGCLPQKLVDQIVLEKNSVLMAADSQSSSQIGDISRFRGMHLLTPTEREARISLRNHEDGLVVLGQKLCEQAESDHVFIKLGSEGLLLRVREDNGEYRTDRIPALNSNPKDVAGAGDSLLVASILSLAVGADPWMSACLGSVAAAIQISRVGNKPLKIRELTHELT